MRGRTPYACIQEGLPLVLFIGRMPYKRTNLFVSLCCAAVSSGREGRRPTTECACSRGWKCGLRNEACEHGVCRIDLCLQNKVLENIEKFAEIQGL